MKQTLLFLFLLASGLQGFAQATAYPVGDLSQCQNEVFDLTSQTPAVLGNQNPLNFVISYFANQSDALNNTNSIADPGVYIAPQQQIIYIRVTNLIDATFDITSFMVEWMMSPVITLQPMSSTICEGEMGVLGIQAEGTNIVYQWYYNSTVIAGATEPFFMVSLEGTYVCHVTSSSCPDVVSDQAVVTFTSSCSNNTLSGTLRLDTSNDGCSPADSAANHVQINCVNGNDVFTTYTNANGNYTFQNVPIGNNVVSVNTNMLNNNFVASPASHTVSFPTNNMSATGDFCLTTTSPVTDAAVYMYPLGDARPGFPVAYGLAVVNMGTTPISGNVTFAYDAAKLVFNSAIPLQSSQTANTIVFNFSNIAPLQAQFHQLNYTVITPPTVNDGDILSFTATASITNTDQHPDNNTVAFNQTVINSFDPNDITVVQGPFIEASQVADELTYIVRFQNTGSASAINVRITNALDTDLNWATFRPIGASHAFETQVHDGEVTFTFDNINLPATVNDEAGSHGYVTYAVRPNSTLGYDDVISNTADIFFDFNLPITTNTVTTQLAPLGINEVQKGSFSFYPNPASQTIVFAIESLQSGEAAIYDMQGKRVFDVTVENNQPVDVSRLTTGVYFIKMELDGQSVIKKLLIE